MVEKKVFCAALATETNSFSPIPTTLADYRNFVYFERGQHPDNGPTMFTAALWEARKRASEFGWVVSEGLCAAALPGGLTTATTYADLKAQILEDLRDAVPVNAVLLGLHGAMMAEGESDCEGDLLEAVRSICGEGATIAATLDPHSHLSDKMLANADLLVSFKEYPHTDIEERASELVSLVNRILMREIKPVSKVIDCEMIAMFYTDLPPVRSLVEHMKSRESDPGVLSISLIHGFASGDCESMGTKVLVFTNNDLPLAEDLASDVAEKVRRLRGQTEEPRLSIKEAIDFVSKTASGPVVIADGADNPGGGAPGDSTHMINALLREGIDNIAAGPIWDPSAVDLLSRWGEGATVSIRVGGKTCKESGVPLDLTAEVTAVRKGFVQGFAGSDWPLGDVVAIRSGNLNVVLSSIRNQCFTTRVFEDLGIDLNKKSAVVVKSNQHFYESFKTLTDQIVYLSAPGVNAISPGLANYRHVNKNLWPLRMNSEQ